MGDRPDRKCNGGQTGIWCGDSATVVCTDETGLQWYACSNPEHQKDRERKETRTIPIEQWWKEFDDIVGGRYDKVTAKKATGHDE
jgi:hypothetical protein